VQDHNGVYVTYASLEEAADNIDKQADQLHHDLQEIQSKVAQVSEHWQGEAKTAYHSVHQKWHANTEEVHTALKSIAARVRIASGDYSATDKKAAAAFHG